MADPPTSGTGPGPPQGESLEHRLDAAVQRLRAVAEVNRQTVREQIDALDMVRKWGGRIEARMTRLEDDLTEVRYLLVVNLIVVILIMLCLTILIRKNTL